MLKGYWLPVLHSHLPFVKHPEYDFFLEEHWLFEAISETYIPLLMNMKRMVDEKIDFRLTVSLTPPLCEMLSDEYLTDLYLHHLDKLIELTEKEIVRLKSDNRFQHLAHFYNGKLTEIKAFFTDFLESSVLKGYKFFKDMGNLEIITCGATHGFLPLLTMNPVAVDAQIRVARDAHIKHFGEPPSGIWLPECAYFSGLDEVLEKYGIKFFFMDTHGLLKGDPGPKYGIYAPVYTHRGVAAFARDQRSSEQVWSDRIGYPGDFDYRDFYRDVGFDADFDYIKPYISPDGLRVFTGLKYYRVTGNEEQKEPYDPEMAFNKTALHAEHFHKERAKQIWNLSNFMDRLPVVVSPYDAELFGHWWFEGPDFLFNIFKEMDRLKYLKPLTPLEYLNLYETNEVIEPRPSSWGANGYYEVWLNENNDWIYKHLHHMASILEGLVEKTVERSVDSVEERVLNQMLRELLLAQSSDWAFLITTQTAVEYSTRRTKEHISNFLKLYELFHSKDKDMLFLEWLECKNSIFPEIDFRIFKNNTD